MIRAAGRPLALPRAGARRRPLRAARRDVAPDGSAHAGCGGANAWMPRSTKSLPRAPWSATSSPARRSCCSRACTRPRTSIAARVRLAGRRDAAVGRARRRRVRCRGWKAKLGLTLSPSQREAVETALGARPRRAHRRPRRRQDHRAARHPHASSAAKGVRPLLAAPTGRAAKRMTEATGLEAKTLHRLLEINPRNGQFRRTERHPLEGDLLVIDEVSMVDVLMMAHVLRAVPSTMAVLLVGDADQLPSVGPGQVLADLIASGAVVVTRLRRDSSPGRGQPHHHDRARHQRGRDADVRRGARQRLLLHRGRRSRDRAAAAAAGGARRASRGASASTRFATSRCCAR